MINELTPYKNLHTQNSTVWETAVQEMVDIVQDTTRV
jgi:hypothetical protein